MEDVSELFLAGLAALGAGAAAGRQGETHRSWTRVQSDDGTLTVEQVNGILRGNMLRFMPQLGRYQT
jgi:hypothetical protein